MSRAETAATSHEAAESPEAQGLVLNAPQAKGRETEPATSGPQPLQMTLQREKLRAVSCDQLAKPGKACETV